MNDMIGTTWLEHLDVRSPAVLCSTKSLMRHMYDRQLAVGTNGAQL